jgi:hypothetical protein
LCSAIVSSCCAAIAARSSGVAQAAASAAASPSISMRALRMSVGLWPVLIGVVSVSGWSRTNAPAPTRTSISPPISSAIIASRTTGRLMRTLLARSRSPGSRCPGANSPARMRAPIWSATCS